MGPLASLFADNSHTHALFFFSLLYSHCLYWLTEWSCVSRRCAANRKKIREIKFFNCRRKFGVHRLLAQGASVQVRQYIGTGIPSYNSSVNFFIYLFSFSRLSPYLYISLPISIFLPISISFPISISLAISFFLAISISLYYTENQNYSKEVCTICCVLPFYGDIA